VIATRTWALGLILALLAAASWWLARQQGPAPLRIPAAAHTPDYWGEGIRALTLDAHGRPHQRLQATASRHFPDDGSTELERPRLLIYRPERPPWHIQAERGWVSQDGGLMLLRGQVRIDRAAAPGVRPVHLVTHDLSVRPRDEYAETDAPVRIESRADWITATGLKAWFHPAVRIKLLARVRGHYEE